MAYVTTISNTRCMSFKQPRNGASLFGGSSLGRAASDLQKRKKASTDGHKKVSRKKGLRRCLEDFDKPLSAPKQFVFSRRSKDKCANKIFSLYKASVGQQFYFLTLTFIASVTDKQGQQCLNKFFTVLRKFATFHYIWVAEHQQDTGNIHFHVILNHRFDIKMVNALWVRQQYNAGICHSKYSAEQIAEFSEAGTVQKYLSPADVKRIDNVDHLSMYLTNYITKNTDTFECRVWHCSRKISELGTRQVAMSEVMTEANDKTINFSVNRKKAKTYFPKMLVTEHCIIISIYNKKHFSKYTTELDELNRKILSGEIHRDNFPRFKVKKHGDAYEILNFKN